MKRRLPLPLAFLPMLVLAQVQVFDTPNQVHFIATVDTLKAELQQIRQLGAGLSGPRDVARLGTAPLNSPFPQNFLSLYADMTAAAGDATRYCAGRSAAEVELCTLALGKSDREQAVTSDLYQHAFEQQGQLTNLIGALSASPDLKSSIDLGNRSTSSQASLESERLQLELFALEAQEEDGRIAATRRRLDLGRLASPSRAIDSLSPPSFAGELP